jgi:hypothetical protein
MNYLLARFLRGALAGAVSNMVVLCGLTINSLGDLKTWGINLGVALVVGAMSGGILALDKFLRSTE